MGSNCHQQREGRARGFVDRAGRTRPVPVIGALGGVASGKSTATAEWARRGAQVIDVDRIGHCVLLDGDVKDALRERFGDEILDAEGAVSRNRLGARVFARRDDLDFLNRLVHPRMRRIVDEEVDAVIGRGARAVVIDAALLLEHDLGASDCTHLIFIDTPETVRQQRAASQRGWRPEELTKRESFQMPLAEKKRAADLVIDNSADKDSLAARVGEWFEELVTRGAVCAPRPDRSNSQQD